MSSKQHSSDASLARALQSEYEKEYRRRAMRQHMRGGGGDHPSQQQPRQPPSRSQRHAPKGIAIPSAPIETDSVGPRMHKKQMTTDEELARRLEQEMMEEELRRQQRRGGGNMSDAQLARRLDQEMQDEIMAQQWAAQERMRRMERREKCGVCCVLRRGLSCIITGALVLVAVILVVYFLQGSGNDFIWDPNRFREEDPFNNANPDDANLWRHNRQGLELTVIDSLEDKWRPYFYRAVREWDAGTPVDALTLDTQMGQVESVCRPVNGKLRVCNGDYGETDWRGINKILLERGWIYSSAARMNDFYVKEDGDDDQKQYTMCHEIGHGFGLPHTDENFFNRDLGNCMDYTENPRNNKQPHEANFLFLAQLYGTVDGSTLPPQNDQVSQQDKVLGNGNNRRLRRTVPASVLAKLDELDELVDTGKLHKLPNHRVLHETDRGIAHEVPLGEGFTAELHLLKAVK